MTDATTQPARATRILTLAGLAWLEARRTRLLWAALAVSALAVSVSLFARSLALTESVRLQISFLAPGARLGAVLLTCLHVLSSMLRESQDRVSDLLLSLELPRGEYLVGKLAGYLAVATAFAVFLGAPVLMVAYGPGAAIWLASLVLECWLVAAAALFCAVTLNHMLLGTAFVMALYLLCRTMTAIVLIATASPFRGEDLWHTGLAHALRGLSWLVPDLAAATRTAWLIDPGGVPSSVAAVMAQMAMGVGLFLGAAMVDLYRRNR